MPCVSERKPRKLALDRVTSLRTLEDGFLRILDCGQNIFRYLL